MALDTAPDPMERATQIARSEQPPAWVDVSSSIMAEVRSIVTPAQPLVTFGPDGSSSRDEQQSRTLVSTRVLVAALRQVLQRPTHAPRRIEVTAESERLVAVDVELVCAYGTDLRALAVRVRAEIAAEVVALVGPDAQFAPRCIGIEVVDVVDGDPTTT